MLYILYFLAEFFYLNLHHELFSLHLSNNVTPLLMSNSLKIVFIALFGLALTIGVTAQNPGTSAATVTQNISLKVDGSALLAIYNSATGATSTGVSLSLSGATQAGAAMIDVTTNSDTRLRISSLVESGKTRSITAQINTNLSSSGTQFFVTLTRPASFQPLATNGGTTAVEQELTDATIKTVVTGISTCWSGTGATDGYTVTYRYAKKSGATALQSKNIIITYTISGES